MTDNSMLKRKIYSLDFAIHEMSLFLDTHPTSEKAMELLALYRKTRENAVAQYEKIYGKYIVDVNDVPTGECWKWIKGPWPWENGFTEE